MKSAPQSDSPFSDRHDVVKTVCLWRNGTCHRIEIVERAAKPGERVTYTALLWMEKEHGASHRVLVRDITFPWVHHESADSAMEHAIGFLEARLKPAIGLEHDPGVQNGNPG
jgi:hypothetical protein